MQAFKMAWKSIWGKKGRSTLTILGIFIGIAAVMTIVSVLEGMKAVSYTHLAPEPVPQKPADSPPGC